MHSIKSKIFVAIILTVIFVQVSFTTFDFISESNREKATLAMNLERLKKNISTSISLPLYNYNVPVALSILETELLGLPYLKSIFVLDSTLQTTASENEVFAGVRRHPDGSITMFDAGSIQEKKLKSSKNKKAIATKTWLSMTFDVMKDESNLGLVVIEYSDDFIKQRVRYILLINVFRMIVFILVLVTVIYFVMNRLIVRSINAMADSFENISEDIRDACVPEESRNDEIGVLQRELNKMINSIYTQNIEIHSLRFYLSAIINAMPSILIATDEQGTITQWNNAAIAFSNITHAEALGKNIWTLLPDLEKYKNIFHQVLKKKRLYHFDKEILESNQNRFFTIELFYIHANEVDGIVWRLDDITEIERKDDQLRRIQKMETIGTLSAGLAHDFNNVLTGVSGSVSMMKMMVRKRDKKPVNFDKMEKYLGLAEHSTKRAAGMVQQLLSISRKQETSFKQVDLSQILEHVSKVCHNTFDPKIEIIINVPDGKIVTQADSSQIEQVVLNLCVNASHAMTIMRKNDQQIGGTLELNIKQLHADKNFLRVHPEAQKQDYWLLQISDSGVGMTPKVMSKIFDPFFTTKEKGSGTGLGLSMVYNIIKQHNGFVDVYSEIGIGTTISIYLPIRQQKKNEQYNAQPEEEEEEENPVMGSGLVLVVDDEEVVREVALNYLELCGYTVIVANDGEEGFRTFQKHHLDIRCVLMDMAMPKMDGKEAFLKMKEFDPAVKVVLASGFKQDKRVQSALTLGVKEFMQKPYTLIELSEVMGKVI